MFRRVFAAGLLTAAAAGCGGGPKPVPAGGVVTLDGEPIDGALVSFIAEEGGHTATGQTDTAGSFTMSTAGKPGVIPGKYKVLVSRGSGGITGGEGTDPLSSTGMDMMKKMKDESQKAAKEASKGSGSGPLSGKKSGMMPPGGGMPGMPPGGGMTGMPTGAAPPPKTDLPAKYATIGTTDLTATVEPGGSQDIRLRLTTPPPAGKK